MISWEAQKRREENFVAQKGAVGRNSLRQHNILIGRLNCWAKKLIFSYMSAKSRIAPDCNSNSQREQLQLKFLLSRFLVGCSGFCSNRTNVGWKRKAHIAEGNFSQRVSSQEI